MTNEHENNDGLVWICDCGEHLARKTLLRYCPKCGQSIEDMADGYQCQECGNILHDGEKCNCTNELVKWVFAVRPYGELGWSRVAMQMQANPHWCQSQWGYIRKNPDGFILTDELKKKVEEYNRLEKEWIHADAK